MDILSDDLGRGRPSASQKPSCSGTPTDDCKERAARVDGVVAEAAHMARQAMISMVSRTAVEYSYVFVLRRFEKEAAFQHLQPSAKSTTSIIHPVPYNAV